MVDATRTKVKVWEVVALVGGAILLAASWAVVAIDKHVPAWESHVFKWINDAPGALWPVIWGPMQIGSFVGSLAVVVVVAIVSRDRRLTLATLVATQAAWWSAKAVKRLASRGRPADLLSGVHLREHARGLGYVSGHTAVAFAVAAVLAPSLPRRWRIAVVALAVVVALARVYAGAHLPLDVVGGAGLGLLCGMVTRWVFGLGGEGLPVRT